MLFLYLTLLFVFQLYKSTITKSRWRSVRKQNQVIMIHVIIHSNYLAVSDWLHQFDGKFAWGHKF